MGPMGPGSLRPMGPLRPRPWDPGVLEAHGSSEALGPIDFSEIYFIYDLNISKYAVFHGDFESAVQVNPNIAQISIFIQF